jgi:hypothetical protein
LVHHGVDGPGGAKELPGQGPSFDLQFHALRQVAAGHGGDHAGHLRRGLDQVGDEGVDGVDVGRPPSGGPANRGALGDPPLLADHGADPLELLGHAFLQVQDVVEGVIDLPGRADLVDWQTRREVSLLERRQDAQ